MDERLTRRGFFRRASGLVAAASGLTLATALPVPAGAEAAEALAGHSSAQDKAQLDGLGGHAPWCGAPYGPLHRYLYHTSPDPAWADGVIWRESNWTPGAYNWRSGATGLAQFIPSTWAWGEGRFNLYGDPGDPYANIDMMNAFLRAGEYYHWALTGEHPQGGRRA